MGDNIVDQHRRLLNKHWKALLEDSQIRIRLENGRRPFSSDEYTPAKVKNYIDESVGDIVYGENISLRSVFRNTNLENIFENLLNTFEVRRMEHLKQAGLSYLEKPAIYTRLEHSAGCCYLADKALEEIKQEGSEETLEKILSGTGKSKILNKAFILALFLHDIGHAPFSHILESNEHYRREFENHEKVAEELITGKRMYFLLKEIVEAAESDKEQKLVYDVLTEEEKNSPGLTDLIAGLINPEYEGVKNVDIYKDKDNRILYKSLQDLVSGIFDLDRMDHYVRDSRYMGLRFAEWNPIDLVKKIRIDGKNRLFVEEDGAQNVIHLLVSMENIHSAQLGRSSIRYYESILNICVSKLIEEKGYTIFELWLLTDEDLLKLIQDECDKGDSELREIFECLRPEKSREIIDIGRTRKGYSPDEMKEARDKVISGSRFSKQDLIYHIPYKEHPNQPSLLQITINWAGRKIPLEEIPEFSGICGGIRDMELVRKNTIRVIAGKLYNEKDKKVIIDKFGKEGIYLG